MSTLTAISSLKLPDHERAILMALHHGLSCELWGYPGYPSHNAVNELQGKIALEDRKDAQWGPEEQIHYGLKRLRVLGLINAAGLDEQAITQFADTGNLRAGGIYDLVDIMESLAGEDGPDGSDGPTDPEGGPTDVAENVQPVAQTAIEAEGSNHPNVTLVDLEKLPTTPAVALSRLLEKTYGMALMPHTDVTRVAELLQGELRKFTQAQTDRYPRQLGLFPLRGVVGEFVNTALPFTEADANCLAYQFLTAIGNAIGRKVWVNFGADRHYANLFLLTIGGTGTGKGQGLNHVKQLMRLADPIWEREHCKYSAASGEAIVKLAAEASGGDTGSDVDESDVGLPSGPGSADGRLLLLLSEISVLWNSMNREGANTSGYLRLAYDGVPLENNRARSKVVARDYVMSLISHCTPEELSGLVDSNAWYNGLVNRFVFALVSKSKTLPRMNRMPDYTSLASKLNNLLSLPYTGLVEFSEEGGKTWDDWVHSLPEYEGILGAAMQRVRPNALRAALIYAALDDSRLVFPGAPFKIEPQHVMAGVEVMERSIASVRWFLNRPMKIGSQQDYEKIRRIREAASKNGGQLSGTELRSLLSHDTQETRQRLASEAGLKLEVSEPGEQGGRKGQVWKN